MLKHFLPLHFSGETVSDITVYIQKSVATCIHRSVKKISKTIREREREEMSPNMSKCGFFISNVGPLLEVKMTENIQS